MGAESSRKRGLPPKSPEEVPRAARRRGQVREPILTFKRARRRRREASATAQRGGGGHVRGPIVTFKRARSLRTKMTLPEVLLWQALRGQRLARLRFRRQHPVGPCILDFYCPSARLAVEVDGATHNSAEQIRHDERRNASLASRNIKVVRIAAADILKRESLEFVPQAIEQAAAPSTAQERGPPPPLRGGGSGDG